MTYYFTLGGGIGDALQEYLDHPFCNRLRSIRELHPEIKVHCYSQVHNNGIEDLLWYHPVIDRHIQIVQLPQFDKYEEFDRSLIHPLAMLWKSFPDLDTYEEHDPVINLSPEEQSALSNLIEQGSYLVIQPFAGLSERDALDSNSLSKLLELLPGVTPIVIGKNAPRVFTTRIEDVFLPFSSAVNLIDKIGIRLTYHLIKNCTAFIGSHSSLVLQAWRYNKPTVCVLPWPKIEDHWNKLDKKYKAGEGRPNTLITRFDDKNFDSLNYQEIVNHLTPYLVGDSVMPKKDKKTVLATRMEAASFTKDLFIEFGHGFGDNAQFTHMLQLYKRRGFNIRIRHEANKTAIYQAAGIESATGEPTTNHPWLYHGGFNSPNRSEGYGNKVYQNLNRLPLPNIGNTDELWEELSSIRLDGSCNSILVQAALDKAEKFCETLPRPIIALNTEGSGWRDQKNLSHETAKELYDLLLDGMPGTLLLTDWDNRVPKLNHGRVRHVKRDLGHIDLSEFFAVLNLCSLVISVDTGPFHYAAFTNVPALGVFHQLYGPCVSLPRPDNAMMVWNKHKEANQAKRGKWNLLPYEGDRPAAKDIARHALRMLRPRYTTNYGSACGLSVGRDIMLQQWVLDLCNGKTDLTQRADRSHTFDFLLRQINSRWATPRIVELGTIGSVDDFAGGGCSTLIFSAFANALDISFTSVDRDETRCQQARQICKDFKPNIVCSDSVKWLKEQTEVIEVLYLDTGERDGADEEMRCLAEVKAAELILRDDSIISIDDTIWDGKWRGMGALAVPYLLQQGWKILASGYQCVLSRNIHKS